MKASKWSRQSRNVRSFPTRQRSSTSACRPHARRARTRGHRLAGRAAAARPQAERPTARGETTMTASRCQGRERERDLSPQGGAPGCGGPLRRARAVLARARRVLALASHSRRLTAAATRRAGRCPRAIVTLEGLRPAGSCAARGMGHQPVGASTSTRALTHSCVRAVDDAGLRAPALRCVAARSCGVFV